MNTIVARHNGKATQTGEHGTAGHPPTPAIHCQLPCSLAVLFAGVGWRALTIQSTSDPPCSSPFNR